MRVRLYETINHSTSDTSSTLQPKLIRCWRCEVLITCIRGEGKSLFYIDILIARYRHVRLVKMIKSEKQLERQFLVLSNPLFFIRYDLNYRRKI